MSEPTVISPGEGEVVGDSPDRRVEILSDHDALHATWSRFAPGRDGADLHVHHRHTDLFYILDGELTLRLGPEDERVVVPAGALARVPPLVVHGFRNGSDSEVRYLNLHAPGRGFASFMRALRDERALTYDQEAPPADGGRPATEVVIGDREVLADQPGVRVTLLANIDEIRISEVWTGLGGEPPSPRIHPGLAESFYVLEGEMVLTSGERELRALSGSWVQVPPGVPHTISPGSGPVRFLNLRAPNCG